MQDLFIFYERNIVDGYQLGPSEPFYIAHFLYGYRKETVVIVSCLSQDTKIPQLSSLVFVLFARSVR